MGMWSGYVQIFSTTALIRLPDIQKSWTNVKNLWISSGYTFQALKKRDVFKGTEACGSLSSTDHTKWLSHVLMTEHRRAGSRCTFWMHPSFLLGLGLGDYQSFVDFMARKSRYMGQRRNCHVIQISPWSAQSREKKSQVNDGGFQCSNETTVSFTGCPSKEFITLSIFPYVLYIAVEKVSAFSECAFDIWRMFLLKKTKGQSTQLL